ncbi:MAG: AAA family ATPase [Ruminococcus sp.]|nr:AAA family ATPase [Ruminococcus sp.]
MNEIIKIAISGGPCAGKSSALLFLKTELEKLGQNVLTLNECATALMQEGKTPDNMGVFEFHSLLFETQLKNENALIEKAKAMNKNKVVLIFDRGLLDSRAYVKGDYFELYAGKFNLNEEKIRNRYDAVFHMVTAADGAENYYNSKTNPQRCESIEDARKLDAELIALWTGTVHLRIIDNSTGFTQKLNRLLDEVKGFLGIPEPLEIERKFLIEMPDLIMLNSMKNCRKIPITQAYLSSKTEGQFRVRKRGEGRNAVYIKTIKHKINDLIRIEIESFISEKEYYNYLFDKESVVGIISKDRYCISMNSTYYELDVYPFWDDKATLEIELLSENQPYVLPDFVKLIREVSFEKEYRNKALAIRHSRGEL